MGFDWNSAKLEVRGPAPFVRETFYSLDVSGVHPYDSDFSAVETELDGELEDVPDMADSVQVIDEDGEAVVEYFPGARELGPNQIEDLGEDTSTLQANMERNDWDYVLETRHESMVPPGENREAVYDIF